MEIFFYPALNQGVVLDHHLLLVGDACHPRALDPYVGERAHLVRLVQRETLVIQVTQVSRHLGYVIHFPEVAGAMRGSLALLVMRALEVQEE